MSVVCPVFNEEEIVDEFYRRVSTAMKSISPAVDYTILFVNDGSSDGTAEMLDKLASEDPKVSVLHFSRNFGHQLAITAGIDHAPGDAVAVIDTDLQDPPEVIVGMVEKWREGWDVVYGRRTARAGESAFKLWTARMFYRLINRISDVALPLDTGDFRLMDRQVVEVLKGIREDNRYMRGLVAWVGFKQCALPYEREVRHAGSTKYPLRKMLRLAVDGISGFSEKPLKLAIQLGAVVTLLSFLAGLTIVVGKVMNPEDQFPGYASMMTVMLFVGGVQLLTIGILGQYVGRTYRETKRRPLYIVAQRQNLENQGPLPPTAPTSTPFLPSSGVRR